MAHNQEAGGSSTSVGVDGRPHKLSLDEVEVFHQAHLLVPPEYRLPYEWNLSNVGYAIRHYRWGQSSMRSSTSVEHG
jgi:hypothetical protein